jgi:hypothetical protein
VAIVDFLMAHSRGADVPVAAGENEQPKLF